MFHITVGGGDDGKNGIGSTATSGTPRLVIVRNQGNY